MDARLKDAAHAIQIEDYSAARKILVSILKTDPNNEQAWLFMAFCVPDTAQQQECLERVLAINPQNQHALQAKSRLLQTSPEDKPHPQKPGSRLANVVFTFVDRFIDLLFRIPTALYAVFGLFILLAALYAYTSLNTDFFGMASPDFSSLKFVGEYQQMENGLGANWKFTYEDRKDTIFHGTVRHVSVNHLKQFPFITHDILVTTGDYADPDLVSTSVANHHFFWRSLNSNYPKGTINLLHVVPEDEEIYKELLNIRNGDLVTISGREILQVDAYDAEGESLGWWRDSGCNTTLVKEVSIGE